MRKILFLLTLASLLLTASCSTPSKKLEKELQGIVDAFPGEAGIAMIRGRDTVCVNGDGQFPMFSVVKFHQALAVCDHFRAEGVEMPAEIKGLLERTLMVSDNDACDILFETTVSPSQVNGYIHNLGIDDCGIAWTEAEQHADIRRCSENWTTPLAAARLLGLFHEIRELDGMSTFIWDTMTKCSTGAGRIPKYISEDVACIAHKTGTGAPLPDGGTMGLGDIACVVLPDGSHFELAIFVKDAACDNAACEELMAQISRACYEFYKD